MNIWSLCSCTNSTEVSALAVRRLIRSRRSPTAHFNNDQHQQLHNTIRCDDSGFVISVSIIWLTKWRRNWRRREECTTVRRLLRDVVDFIILSVSINRRYCFWCCIGNNFLLAARIMFKWPFSCGVCIYFSVIDSHSPFQLKLLLFDDVTKSTSFLYNSSHCFMRSFLCGFFFVKWKWKLFAHSKINTEQRPFDVTLLVRTTLQWGMTEGERGMHHNSNGEFSGVCIIARAET